MSSPASGFRLSASAPQAPRWAWWVATGFGSGRLRPAPGTWGSLAAVLGWALILALTATPFSTWALGHGSHPNVARYGGLLEAFLLALPIGMTWVAVRASEHVVNETGEKDPSFIVADEWAGQWIALWPLRWFLAQNLFRIGRPGGWKVLVLLALPFGLFRLLDIWKPWPCHAIQSLPGGQGVVADDVVAGLYAIPLVMVLFPVAETFLR